MANVLGERGEGKNKLTTPIIHKDHAKNMFLSLEKKLILTIVWSIFRWISI